DKTLDRLDRHVWIVIVLKQELQSNFSGAGAFGHTAVWSRLEVGAASQSAECSGQLAKKIDHLNRRESSFESLVSGLRACPIDRLLERVACQDTKNDRDVGGQGHLGNSFGGLAGHITVVVRVSANYGAQANNRGILPTRRQPPGNRGYVKGSRNSD